MSTKSRSILKRDNDNTKRFVAGLKNAVRTFEFTSAASFPAGTGRVAEIYLAFFLRSPNARQCWGRIFVFRSIPVYLFRHGGVN
ncbi:hypothetical protein TNCT_179921 [Trichonephila clavata]|uniref:Uncharacterized protein n=1 Tax=Trichonephila clavata TaxID=2740835 RepID=A0A8X6FZ16_TRICU|nr:hypothetical protein TNCT_179921 [Trichonephila clavata]